MSPIVPIVRGGGKIYLTSARQSIFACPYVAFYKFDAVPPFLKAATVAQYHRALLFLNKDSVILLNNMVRMLAIGAALREWGYKAVE